MMNPDLAQAYRLAAAAVPAAEGRRWAMQLCLTRLIDHGGSPDAIVIADAANRTAAWRLAVAVEQLEDAEAALRAALPTPLVLP